MPDLNSPNNNGIKGPRFQEIKCEWIEVGLNGEHHHIPPRMMRWEEFKENPSQNIDYTSAYRFTSEDPYKGPVISNFYMDFDSEQDINRARKEVLKVGRFFWDLGVPEDQVRVVFSGKKGFWIFVSKHFFGATPREDLPAIWRKVAESLKEILRLKTADFQIYHRRVMIRLNNRPHQDTKLYRIPVRFQELDFEIYRHSMEEIQGYAKGPRTDLIPPSDAVRPIETLQRLYQKCVKIVEEYHRRFAERDISFQHVKSIDCVPIWLKKRLEKKVQRGRGLWNLTVFQTAAALAQYGVNKDDASRALMEFAEPTNESERMEVESTFDSAWKGVSEKRYSVTAYSDAFIEFVNQEKREKQQLDQTESGKVENGGAAVRVLEVAREIASKFFLDQTGTAYAWVPLLTTNGTRDADSAKELVQQIYSNTNDNDGKNKGVPGHPVALSSREFKAMLATAYYRKFESAVGIESVSAAANLLYGLCLESKDRCELGLRCVFQNGDIIIDRGDEDWHAWVISKDDGATLVHQDRPLFKRYGHMRQLSNVDLSGTAEDIKSFLSYFHVKTGSLDDDIALLVGHLGTAFAAHIPHAILIVTGPQGAAKTTLTNALRRLIDPSVLSNIHLSSDPKEFIQSLAHHYMPVFDNVTFIEREWQLDTLCRTITGEGFSKRGLYTDDTDFIYQFKHMPAMNGINVPFSRGDILDRALVIEVERVSTEERKSEREVELYLEMMIPKVLGAIFNTLPKAMSLVTNVDQELRGRLPRLADYCIWAESFCQAVGYEKGLFLKRFNEKMEDNASLSVEGDAICELITLMINPATEPWDGTASKLLASLRNLDNERGGLYKDVLPREPRKLGRMLNNIKVGLHSRGIAIERPQRSGRERTIRIRKLDLVVVAKTQTVGG